MSAGVFFKTIQIRVILEKHRPSIYRLSAELVPQGIGRVVSEYDPYHSHNAPVDRHSGFQGIPNGVSFIPANSEEKDYAGVICCYLIKVPPVFRMRIH